jgi:hypothetical protein
LSVGDVVVDAGVVVVVLLAPEPAVVVVPAPPPPVVGFVVVVVVVVVVLPPPDAPGAVVVVVAGGAGGATKGTVSPRMVVTLADGVADRFVHPRAAFQLVTAAVAGAPVSGCGTPLRSVAGRHTAPVMCRPCAVRMSVPLLVSGAVSS